MAEQSPDDRERSRRQFLKSVAGAASALALASVTGSDTLAADTPAPAATPETPPVAPPTYGPDFSICRSAEERALLERQYASALELAQTIRKAPLPPWIEPVTTFAALPRLVSATVPPPPPAPQTPPARDDR